MNTHAPNNKTPVVCTHTEESLIQKGKSLLTCLCTGCVINTCEASFTREKNTILFCSSAVIRE